MLFTLKLIVSKSTSEMCIKFDSNLVCYLLSVYVNMDVIYFEINYKQLNRNGLIRCDCFRNHMFCIKIIHVDIRGN